MFEKSLPAGDRQKAPTVEWKEQTIQAAKLRFKQRASCTVLECY